MFSVCGRLHSIDTYVVHIIHTYTHTEAAEKIVDVTRASNLPDLHTKMALLGVARLAAEVSRLDCQ